MIVAASEIPISPLSGCLPIMAIFGFMVIVAVWIVSRFKKPAKCFCKVTEACDGRVRQERIPADVVDFLRDLAMLHGLGMTGDREIQYRGTDIVARFRPGKLDRDIGIPVVEMWTIYHDEAAYTKTGELKQAGKHQRIYRLRSRDHQEGVENQSSDY